MSTTTDDAWAATDDGPTSQSSSSGGTSSAQARQSVTAKLRSMVVDVVKTMHVPRLVYGVVSAVATATPTCSVTLQGTSTVITGVKFDQRYGPVIGDVVYCARVGTDMFIMGKIATASGWTPYTPVWAATTVNPTLGNGTLLGRYQMLGPKTCAVRFQLTAGTTTTAGTGTYTWTLPFTSSALIGSQTGTGLLDNPGAGVIYNGIWLPTVNTNSSTFLIPNGAGAASTQIGNTIMANGVFIIGCLVYEIA